MEVCFCSCLRSSGMWPLAHPALIWPAVGLARADLEGEDGFILLSHSFPECVSASSSASAAPRSLVLAASILAALAAFLVGVFWALEGSSFKCSGIRRKQTRGSRIVGLCVLSQNSSTNAPPAHCFPLQISVSQGSYRSSAQENVSVVTTPICRRTKRSLSLSIL